MNRRIPSGNKSATIFGIGVFLIPLVFYTFYWLTDGVVWCADSISYVTLYDSREPLYPCILAIFRTIVGFRESLPVEEQPYLFWVVGAQSLLAAVSVSSLVSYLTRRLKLSAFLSVVLAVIPLAVSLLNRYAAKRGSMYSNCILTEGIAISIYLLFIRNLYEYICEGKTGAYIGAAVFALLGISARKQMYVCLLLMVIASVVKLIESGVKKRRERRISQSTVSAGSAPAIIGLCAVSVIAVVGISTLFDCTYNYALRGSFIRHTEDNRFVTTMAMYTADREFAGYIPEELRDIFLEIYDECDDAGYLGHYAPSGWLGSVDHFAQNYDHIQLDVMEAVLEREADLVAFAPVKEAQTHSARMDAVRAEFNRALLPHEAGRILKVFAYNFLSGLVLTVSKLHPVLCVYAAVVFAIYMGLIVYGIIVLRRKHPSEETAAPGYAGKVPAGKDPLGKDLVDEDPAGRVPAGEVPAEKVPGAEFLYDTLLFMLLVLAGTLVNVGLVSAVIFCQTRYTIYNFPLFYMALVCMIYAIYRDKRQEKR